jgi:hypothetical protein
MMKQEEMKSWPRDQSKQLNCTEIWRGKSNQIGFHSHVLKVIQTNIPSVQVLRPLSESQQHHSTVNQTASNSLSRSVSTRTSTKLKQMNSVSFRSTHPNYNIQFQREHQLFIRICYFGCDNLEQ